MRCLVETGCTGRTFLMISPAGTSTQTAALILVQDSFEELERLAPTQ